MNNVALIRKSLGTILSQPISIPEYQRVYCWPEKNVLQLLDDIIQGREEWDSEHPYHLGTIILQAKDNRLEIIDGQQRMVTISLLLYELGDDSSPLLTESFQSAEAVKYVAYNRYLIHNYVERYGWDEECKKKRVAGLKENLHFDVLELRESSLDLAYTFFSSQNARGKALTDYELLKSHHLRFIPIEEQQKHLAKKWDNLLVRSERAEGDKSVSIAIGLYLYCLRKWTRKRTWYHKEKNRVKHEYEAAPVILEVPPFGEAFTFNEAIQGGTHFFAFVDQFVQRYNNFQQTEAYKILWNTISCSGILVNPEDGKKVQNKKRTHYWYGDVIATFLFAYYLKFGTDYIHEALTAITRIVSMFRYETSKANQQSLLDKAGESEIVLMINQATSPTFCLAEMRNIINRLPMLSPEQKQYIRADYLKWEKALYKRNSQYYMLDFKSLHNNA